MGKEEVLFQIIDQLERMELIYSIFASHHVSLYLILLRYITLH